ncbi:hypothetical protein LCGC14_0283000 [marine sediment metagenome]|uniref:Uncharacterized protein n=1 Tax=marine sediment metagenome TaxID=412755 RepID=A0A0F9WGU0_9ZZZZ
MADTKKVQKQTAAYRLVADDNGYADHKFAWYSDDGTILTGKVPSLIQVGGVGLGKTTGERVGAYMCDGVEYTCSAAINDRMDIRNADYPTSVANRVLFNHGLTRFGLLGIPVRAALTLPIRDFFSDGGVINTALRTASAESLSKRNVEVVGCEAQPDVVSVQIYAEALSAWFDWAMTDTGDYSQDYIEMEETLGEVLVVDVGGSTTDLLSVQMINETGDGEMIINNGKSGTEKVGVIDAKAKLEELIRKKMQSEGIEGISGHGSTFPSHWLERVLSTGKASYSGRTWDFTEERDTACRGVAERISGFIKTRVGSTATYQSILVVGGGAIVFRKWLELLLPNADFKDEFANARGLLKFMNSQQQV